uniref:DUF6110 family protein n=1 Tax=Agathobacter sp. TaxID=2021311 RepID=UPI004057BD5B
MIGTGSLLCFAAGVLFGTAGVKVLSGTDAKKAYVKTTAAVLRAKDCVMDTVTNIQAGAEDIYAEAVALNEERAAEEAVKKAYENGEFEDEPVVEE